MFSSNTCLEGAATIFNKENSPSDPAQAHPDMVSRVFGFKKMKEHVNRRGEAKMP